MSVLQRTRGLMLIVSGPAGSGKTTICDRLTRTHAPELERVITATTRAPRKNESDGGDYHFLTDEEFEGKLAEDAFYEHALVYEKKYGVLKSAVLGKLEAGVDLVLNLDVQGAATFRRAAEKDLFLGSCLVSLFLMPANVEIIRRRLDGRGTDGGEEINRRLGVAEEEMVRWQEYDYCIVSGNKDDDFARVDAIYRAEQSRVARLAEKG